MKGVMALASQKVEELTSDNPNGNSDNWQRNENGRNGSYQEFNHENKGWNSSIREGQPSSGGQTNTYSSSWDDWDHKDSTKGGPARGSAPQSSNGRNNSSSWDDWDHKDARKVEPAKGSSPHNNDSWAGWDDAKDDDFDNKASDHNGTSGSGWTGGGFL